MESEGNSFDFRLENDPSSPGTGGEGAGQLACRKGCSSQKASALLGATHAHPIVFRRTVAEAEWRRQLGGAQVCLGTRLGPIPPV